MKKREREKQIMNLLRREGSVTVGQLSDLMDVSAVTIRADLTSLEAEGLLLRTHGGAILNEKVPTAVIPAADASLGCKQLIAKAARNCIRENTWIFLGSGTTCLALAEELKDFPINVMTNNLAVAQVLSQSGRGQVIMPGGAVFGGNCPFLYGDLLHASLDSVVLSQAFLGVSGVDAHFGYSVSNAVECSIFTRLRQISGELVILADASKFGKTSFMGAGPLSIADAIITDEVADENCLRWCTDAGVRLIQAK